MKDILIVIPARMSSSRLPGKPLIKIMGVPMIHHVWNRALQVTSSDNIVVATEDNEIIDYCITNDINCILTDKAASEVDRVKLVSDKIAAKIYICACGDEPLINVEDIKTIIAKNIFGEFRDILSTLFTLIVVSERRYVCDPNLSF